MIPNILHDRLVENLSTLEHCFTHKDIGVFSIFYYDGHKFIRCVFFTFAGNSHAVELKSEDPVGLPLMDSIVDAIKASIDEQKPD